MGKPRSPRDLAQASYRRQRLIDAQRMLPVLMLCLWLLPLLWPGETGARAFLHVFAVWSVGIVGAAWLTWRLRRGEPAGDGGGADAHADL